LPGAWPASPAHHVFARTLARWIEPVIVLNLECSQAHAFEGWFASAGTFESQQAAGQVACPVCGCTDIRRMPNAPYVRTHSASKPAAAPSTEVQLARFISTLREAAGKAEDVGKAFAEEARRIHYGESPERSIRGQASGDEIVALVDEGISVLPVPPAKEDLH